MPSIAHTSQFRDSEHADPDASTGQLSLRQREFLVSALFESGASFAQAIHLQDDVSRALACDRYIRRSAQGTMLAKLAFAPDIQRGLSRSGEAVNIMAALGTFATLLDHFQRDPHDIAYELAHIEHPGRRADEVQELFTQVDQAAQTMEDRFGSVIPVETISPSQRFYRLSGHVALLHWRQPRWDMRSIHTIEAFERSAFAVIPDYGDMQETVIEDKLPPQLATGALDLENAKDITTVETDNGALKIVPLSTAVIIRARQRATASRHTA